MEALVVGPCSAQIGFCSQPEFGLFFGMCYPRGMPTSIEVIDFCIAWSQSRVVELCERAALPPLIDGVVGADQKHADAEAKKWVELCMRAGGMRFQMEQHMGYVPGIVPAAKQLASSVDPESETSVIEIIRVDLEAEKKRVQEEYAKKI